MIDAAMTEAISSGLFMETAAIEQYTGKGLTIGTEQLLNFGACSYLGLETRPELKDGAERALREIGTQFPFPRGYVQSPLYAELEDGLDKVTGACALVASNTTLGHISALPVLVESNDAVVIDQFAHASLQIATALLDCAEIQHLRHNNVGQLARILTKATRSHDRVWYVCDGLYSMLGDLAPVQQIRELLDTYPQLHLYLDDAHSTSWSGSHGRGHALDLLVGHPRVIVALSLNKAFSAAGGALVFPNRDLYWKVRRCGGPMLFSGPIQPPMLGAAVASVKLHLSAQFPALQAAELERIRTALRLCKELGVPLGSTDETPIFFVPCGPETAAFALVRALRLRGYYACSSVFPAVPRNHAGIRFTISIHNEQADIEGFISCLAEECARLGIDNQRGVSKRPPLRRSAA